MSRKDRERIYAAEEAFGEITGEGRELITSASEPSFEFYDGEIINGYEAAADRAEQHVRNIGKGER
jgi:hypothetical protein